MTTYDSARDSIVTRSGRIISVSRAEQLVYELEAAIETAHAYRTSPELHDIGLNERALNHLLTPTKEEYQLRVNVSHTEDADLATEHLIEILNRRPAHGLLDAHINAPDIRPFFEDSAGITGFHVELP